MNDSDQWNVGEPGGFRRSWDTLRRVTGVDACAQHQPDTKHVDVLDGIRALAILIVAWFHIWQQSWMWPSLRTTIALPFGGSLPVDINLSPLIQTGYIMVDLMLLLSGFLLFLPYARLMVQNAHGESPLTKQKLPGIKDFYMRRALRILPSYWLTLALVLVYVLLYFRGSPSYGFTSGKQLWLDLWSHLTFTEVFHYDTYIATRLNVVLWTLAIEVHFYLIFPWIARVFVKWPGWTWLVMVAAGLSFRAFVVRPQPDTNLWVNQMPTFLDVYANGMLAALCYAHLTKVLRHTRWTRWLFTAVALVVLVPLWQIILVHADPNTPEMLQRYPGVSSYELIRINQANYRFIFSVYLSVFIVAAANSVTALRYLLSNKVMRIASAVSFQFYIWHQYIAAQLHNHWKFPPSVHALPNEAGDRVWQWQYTLCAFGIPLLLSILLTYGFEQPIAKYGWKVWQRHKEKVAQRKQAVQSTEMEA